MDFEAPLITLDRDETKGSEARSAPIVPGDMLTLLRPAKNAGGPTCSIGTGDHGLSRGVGGRLQRCRCAGFEIPRSSSYGSEEHETSCIPDVIRMKISGHKTDSMERRYNITDLEDMANARDRLET
jgi:hypothetical protein